MRNLGVLLLLLSNWAVAQTAIYTWVDAEGDHFTDDPSKVPHGVKATTTLGEDVSTVQTDEKPTDAKEKPRASAAVRDPNAERASLLALETAWRQQFRDARESIQRLEDDIAVDSNAVETVSGMPISLQYHCVYANGFGGPGSGCYALPSPDYQLRKDRLEQNRRALVRAKEALHDLERRAAQNAVPLEWRK